MVGLQVRPQPEHALLNRASTARTGDECDPPACQALRTVTMVPWARSAMNCWTAGGMFLSPVGITK